MYSKKASLFRGKRLRGTRLDGAGRPIIGADSVVVTKGFVTAAFAEVMSEGESLTATNANGDTCVNEPGTNQKTGYTVNIEFCEVDFALLEMFTGQPLVLNEDGVPVGIDEVVGLDLSDVNIALELWTGADTKGATPSVGSQGQFGYLLTPFLTGGTIGDITIENAAVTFSVNNMTTRSGAAWGAGPYNVELVGGVPAPLYQPLTSSTFRRIMITEVAPPEPFNGSMPLLDSTDPALTDITATPTGLSVALAPVPAGTDPVVYDFGDGYWDYANTGSHTYEYETAGTYTIKATRGTSTVSKTVTVSA